MWCALFCHSRIVGQLGMMITMTQPPMIPAQLTADGLLRELVTIRVETQGIALKMEGLLARYETTTADVADHEARLRTMEGRIPRGLTDRLVTLEKWQLRAGAITGFIGLVVGVLSGYLSTLLMHH